MKMKMKRVDWRSTQGTHLVGYIKISYQSLVNKLGRPDAPTPDGKTKASWLLNVEGQPITIYDYKTSKTPSAITNWHIGGKNATLTLMLVQKLFPRNKVMNR
jgi:hypothetical protein